MARNISDVDKNLRTEATILKDGFAFYNIDEEPFRIYGIFREGDKYRRIPEEVARATNGGVHFLHANTAGGRVRFKTDSRRIAILAKMVNPGKMPHFALTGSVGFDLYVKEEDGYNYVNTFVPPFDITDTLEGTREFETAALRDLTINFPLYSDVAELLIGIDEGSVLLAGDEYLPGAPVVYYGSSITQGGCASRAGTAYQGHICRRFDRDFVNLGFSGSACAEDAIVQHIAGLDMSLFVMDYDYNAPTPKYLESTHEKMFRTIRAAHPTLPIIIMNRPQFCPCEDYEKRHAIVRRTYDRAVAEGDLNVYFIDGRTLMSYCKNEGTVDNCHPTDLGFYSMALAVGDVMERIYGLI